METHRRRFLQHLAAAGLAAGAAGRIAPAAANEPGWPRKPLRLIVPFTTGTPPDLVSRLVAQPLSKSLGQPVIVDNRPGAIGGVALGELLRQPADGHTLFCMLMPVTTAPALVPGFKFDLVREIQPVAQLDWSVSVLVVNRALPAANVAELISLAKARPGQLAFASGGNGTPAHLAAELFKAKYGLSATHVPYAQFAQSLPDLQENRVQFMFMSSAVAVSHVTSGKVRALAVVANERLKALPDVPTMVEQGHADFDVRNWDGIVVRAGTPPEIVERLNQELVRIVSAPEMRERFLDMGVVPAPGTPQALGELIQRDMERWGRVIRAAGIQAS